MSEKYQTERNFILRLKQNTNIITSGIEDAKIALKTQMKTLEDKGQLVVCFYKGSEEDDVVRVIGGITGSDTLLINDFEVTKEITEAIDNLKDGVDADFDTLKKIEDYINNLDFTSPAVDGQYISEFEQENGQIVNLKRVDISDAPLNKYTKFIFGEDEITPIEKNDSIKLAFNKLEHQVDKEIYDRKKAVDTLLTSHYERTPYKFIQKVAQKTDEDIFEFTEEELNAEKVKAYPIDETDGIINVTGENIKQQIEAIATRIKLNENQNNDYKIVKLNDTEKNTLSDGANVFEAYKLITWEHSKGETTAMQIGDTIKIYKDQHLDNVELIGKDSKEGKEQVLRFTYILSDGTTKVVDVDFAEILFQSEYKDGLALDNGVVYVNIDPTSETDSSTLENKFLTVSSNGIKIDHIKDEIEREIKSIDTIDGGTF